MHSIPYGSLQRDGLDAGDGLADVEGVLVGEVGVGAGVGGVDGGAELVDGVGGYDGAGGALVASAEHSLAEDAGDGAGDVAH